MTPQPRRRLSLIALGASAATHSGDSGAQLGLERPRLVRITDQPPNDDPKPYVWHKTADQILGSLVSYCQRINDSGH